MGLKDIVYCIIVDSQVSGGLTTEKATQAVMNAICAKFRHDWPMEFIDTGDEIRTYVSGPCKQCGEEEP